MALTHSQIKRRLHRQRPRGRRHQELLDLASSGSDAIDIKQSDELYPAHRIIAEQKEYDAVLDESYRHHVASCVDEIDEFVGEIAEHERLELEKELEESIDESKMALSENLEEKEIARLAELEYEIEWPQSRDFRIVKSGAQSYEELSLGVETQKNQKRRR